LGEDGIEHLDDETLLGARQTLDTLDLLLQLRGGAALGGLHVLFANEFLERDGECLGDLRQLRGSINLTMRNRNIDPGYVAGIGRELGCAREGMCSHGC
jgi:hypothetical protein